LALHWAVETTVQDIPFALMIFEARMRRASSCAFLFSILFFPNALFAAAFDTHSRIYFHSLADASTTAWSSEFNQEYQSAASAVFDDAVPSESLPEGSRVSTSHVAFANLNAADFIGADTSAVLVGPTGGLGATGTSYVAWRDVAYSGGGGAGSTIRLVFEIKGDLGGNSSISVNWYDHVNGWDGQGGGQASVQTGQAPAGWDSLESVGPSGFRGTVHIDVPYDPNYAGYSWVLSLQGWAYAQPSEDLPSVFSYATSMRSVGLLAVTDTNGNPITGVTLDSGMLNVLPGDYNGDGGFDARDYVLWRKTDGLNSAGYDLWRFSFGVGNGSGLGTRTTSQPVPEAGAVFLSLAAVVSVIRQRRQRRRI
jgi:hypothetical protein